MKKENKHDTLELVKLAIIGLIISVAIAIPVNSPLAILKLAFSYLLIFYMPLLPVAAMMKGSIAEKFLCANILGLSYSMVYIVMDVIFKLPLTKTLFTCITALIAISCYSYYFKIYAQDQK
jgi:hypothetical protein